MSIQVISFNCILKNKAGKLLSTTYNRDVLNAVETDPSGFLMGLTKNLQNLKKGEKRSIEVAAEEAYGLYDPKKIILYPRKKLPKNARKGEHVQIVSKTGVVRSYHITELYSDFASLDGNHPLAGQDLVFEIETLAVRDATRKEIDASANRVVDQVLH